MKVKCNVDGFGERLERVQMKAKCAQNIWPGRNAARKKSSANSFLSITLHKNNRHDRDKRREGEKLSLVMREDYKIIALRGAL